MLLKNKVTFVIPSHNRPYESYCLVSKLISHGFKVILVENNSCSKNISLYKSYFSKLISENFTISYNKFSTNSYFKTNSASIARNFGFNKVKTEFVIFFDDDDDIHSETLQYIKSFDISDNVEFLVMPYLYSSNKRCLPISAYSSYKFIKRYGHRGNSCTLILSSSYVKKIGSWNSSFIAAQDTDFFIRVFKHSKNFIILNCMPIVIYDDFRSRITLSPLLQMASKIQFLYHHWFNIHILRFLKYLISFFLFIPYIKYFLSYVLIHFNEKES